MSNKVVSIRESQTEIEGMELHASAAALDASLSQTAEQCPRLRAIGWCIDGTPGSLCCVQESDSNKMVILPTAQEQAKTLAWAIHSLPAVLVEVP